MCRAGGGRVHGDTFTRQKSLSVLLSSMSVLFLSPMCLFLLCSLSLQSCALVSMSLHLVEWKLLMLCDDGGSLICPGRAAHR